MNKTENFLYIGSGNSALNTKGKDLSNYTIVCANNAWRLFEESSFDIWIHSGDFPNYNFPKVKNYKEEVSYKEYSQTSNNAAKTLGWKTNYPQHYAGYTIFFQGLYWIMMNKNPKKIGVLGFDHDYNPDKVKKWKDAKNPNIQNNFNDKTVKNMNDWANNFFNGLKQDSFYGQGTPDPLRLGENHLLEKFEIAKESASKLNISLVNYSGVTTGINTFEKEFF